MPKSSPVLDDLLSLGNSLLGNIMEARHDFKAQAKTRAGSLATKFDLVSREEFDAAFAMLANAREIQEELRERVAKIEAHLHLSSAAKNKNPKKRSLPSVKLGKNRARKK